MLLILVTKCVGSGCSSLHAVNPFFFFFDKTPSNIIVLLKFSSMFKSVRAKLSIDGKTWKTLASNLRNQIIFYILNSYFLRLFENYVLDRPESLHSGE